MGALNHEEQHKADVFSIIKSMPASMIDVQKSPKIGENFENFCLRLDLDELEDMYSSYITRKTQQYETIHDQKAISTEENLNMIELLRRYLILQTTNELSEDQKVKCEEIFLRLGIKTQVKETLN